MTSNGNGQAVEGRTMSSTRTDFSAGALKPAGYAELERVECPDIPAVTVLEYTVEDLLLGTLDVKNALIPNTHLKQLTGPNQIAQLLVPIVHRGEGAVVGNILPNLAQMRPAV